MYESCIVAKEITSALNHNEPVVALESSVIAHGLPAGANEKAASIMVDAVRRNGAVPAVIGIVDGKIKVGLDDSDISKLARNQVEKLNAGSIPYALWKKQSGGLTVSGTVKIASAVGITTVATGGIGGVHKNAAYTFDISADLWELTQVPVTVVSSGFKSILDVPATMEWLESHCLPIYGYCTNELPGFYTNTTGIKVPSIDSEEDYVAFATAARSEVGFGGAILIAVPVPSDYALDVELYVEQATKEAEAEGVSGKSLTPFLLHRLSELSNAKTIETNLALLENNCAVAARLAKAVAKASSRKCGFTV